jgi:hypothetical protein
VADPGQAQVPAVAGQSVARGCSDAAPTAGHDARAAAHRGPAAVRAVRERRLPCVGSLSTDVEPPRSSRQQARSVPATVARGKRVFQWPRCHPPSIFCQTAPRPTDAENGRRQRGRRSSAARPTRPWCVRGRALAAAAAGYRAPDHSCGNGHAIGGGGSVQPLGDAEGEAHGRRQAADSLRDTVEIGRDRRYGEAPPPRRPHRSCGDSFHDDGPPRTVRSRAVRRCEAMEDVAQSSSDRSPSSL